MNRRIFGAIVAVFACLQPALAMDPHHPGAPSVVIDAAYGGAENGPRLDGALLAKEVTLAVAARTEALLGNRGVTAHLTRRTDETLSPAERLRKVRGVDSAVVVHVRAEPFDRTCVNIQVPQSLTEPRMAGKGVNEYMMDRWRDDQAARSGAAAAAIALSLQNMGVELCGTTSGAPDPVLDHIVQPVVIVVGKIARAPQKGTASGSALSDRIAEGIAAGLADVLSGVAAK